MDWVSIAVNIGLKIFGLVLDKMAADAALKATFLQFVNQLEERQMISSKVRASYQNQLEKLSGDKP